MQMYVFRELHVYGGQKQAIYPLELVRFSDREMSSTWVEAIAIFRAIEEHIFEVNLKVNCGGENFDK